MIHQLGFAEGAVRVVEGVPPVPPQRLVHMGRGANAIGGDLGQEGRSHAVLMRDLLDRVLGQEVVIGAGQGVGVDDIQLFLPGLGLALGAFHRDAHRIEVIADGLHDRLFLGGLEDVVILVVARHRLHVAKAVGGDLVMGALVEEELQLGGHHGREAHCPGAGDLALEHLTRGVRRGRVGFVVDQVAEHHCGGVEPGHPADRAEIRFHRQIAIAPFPRGGGIARHGCHGEIGSQQVVAAMGFALGHVEKGLCVEPFANEAALHVDGAGQHGVDALIIDVRLKLLVADGHLRLPVRLRRRLCHGPASLPAWRRGRLWRAPAGGRPLRW